MLNLKGKSFGYLTVIKRTDNNKYGSSTWLCKCKCNCKNCTKETIVVGHDLTKGKTTICGAQYTGKNSPHWEGGTNITIFDIYASRLKWVEEVRRNPKNKIQLQVKCALCKKWFIPTVTQVEHRIKAINSLTQGDSNLYCSDECKKACPVYRRYKYKKGQRNNINSRPGQREFHDHVIVCAEYRCQICGEIIENDEAHHIESILYSPLESMDIDNGIYVCKKCHKKLHKDINCRPVDLRCNHKK